MACTNRDAAVITLVAVLDNHVLCIHYVGHGDLLAYIDQIAAMVSG